MISSKVFSSLFAIKSIQLIVISTLILTCSYLFRNEQVQHLDWIFPYCSGAANFTTLFDWQMNPNEYDKIASMSNAEHRSYQYQASTQTIQNSVNEYGYVLVALLARHLFPMLGDLQAIILLQTITHLLISLFIFYYLLESTLQKKLFIVFYAINPLVLHIVTFPFYYFWAVFPSFALAIIWFKPSKLQIWLPILTPIILFSLLVRPTGIFLAAFIYLLAFMKNKNIYSRQIVVGSFICFIIGSIMILHQNTHRSLFHTIYIGIGAYSNPYNINALTDMEGYQYYQQMKGIKISTHALHGNWKEKDIMQNYNETLKKRYFEIWQKSPMLLLRNALLNTIQAFGFGYDTQHVWTRMLGLFIGILVIGLFYYTQQWVWFFSVLISASFTFYFPPIPAYLFGSYLLLTFGLINAFEKVVQYSLGHRTQLFVSSNG